MKTVDQIINECSKLAQKKTRHDWVGYVIHWELCKKTKTVEWGVTVISVIICALGAVSKRPQR